MTHIHTGMNAREVATTVRSAADLIDSQGAEIQAMKVRINALEENLATTQRLRQRAQENYENVLQDWTADREKLDLCRETIKELRKGAQS